MAGYGQQQRGLEKLSHIGRYFNTLELLLSHPGGLALSEISDQTQVPMATAHRILSALRERGYVCQNEHDHYRLTLMIPSMGVNYITETGFAGIMQPLLDDLSTETGEHVRLAAVAEDHLTWVLQATKNTKGLQYRRALDEKIIPHTTAAGKAWLATMRDERAMRILAAWDIENTRDYAGPNARVSIRDIFDDIALIREEGHAVVREEGEVGVCVVAVAVFDPSRPDNSTPVATLSIAGPIARMREETLGAHIERLKRSAIKVGEHWSLWTALTSSPA